MGVKVGKTPGLETPIERETQSTYKRNSRLRGFKGKNGAKVDDEPNKRGKEKKTMGKKKKNVEKRKTVWYDVVHNDVENRENRK